MNISQAHLYYIGHISVCNQKGEWKNVKLSNSRFKHHRKRGGNISVWNIHIQKSQRNERQLKQQEVLSKTKGVKHEPNHFKHQSIRQIRLDEKENHARREQR
jgi:hypothetical protein